MTNTLVDFHCHLDLYPDHAAAVRECEREGIQTLTVTTTPKAWPRNRELAAKTHFVRAALGLHPQLVAQRASELHLWESYLTQARYVGEVGLDAGPRYYSSLRLQKEIFTKILGSCCRMGGKILTVHSVRSASLVLDLLEKHLPSDRGRVVLHWFTGSLAEAQRAIALGCYFSVNIEMLKKEQHRKMVATLPPTRILTETDGPFCQYEGHPIHPKNVSDVTGQLAQISNKEPAAIMTDVLSNLSCLESF
jgi:TatD DNase family protein